MGGIMLAVGEGAESAVLQGVTALRRRSHQSTSVWSSHDVALAYVGKHEGLAVAPEGTMVAAVDGEILAGERTDSGLAAATAVLHAYERHGVDLAAPSGQLAAAIWDDSTRTLVLVVDRLGTRPLYLARQDRLLLVSSELKGLVAAGLEPRLDLDGAAELLAYEHLLGETAPLAGVRLLPPASTTVITAGDERSIDRGRYRFDPAPEADTSESVARFALLLERAVVRRWEAGTGLALSGGLDSRCLATIVARHWPESPAFTFGAAGSEEIERASAVARLAGLPHSVVTLDPGYVARDAEETVWLSEGQIRCFHSHQLALRAVRRDHAIGSLLVGYAGDVVVRAGAMTISDDFGFRNGSGDLVDAVHARSAVAVGDATFEQVLTPRFADELRGRAREGLRRAFAAFDGPDQLRRLDFAVQEVYRRKILPGVELFADDVVHRDPYTDDELLDFLAALPIRLRAGGALQRAYLRTFPTLARVRNPKDGVPPALEGRRRALALAAVGARRRSRSRADRLLRRVAVVPRTGLGDYAVQLRGAAGERLLGLLLDERTLDRGQVRREGVRPLVEETVAGRASHTQVLGTLLTLELFQRLFVDGDGFADAPGRVGTKMTQTIG